MTVPGQRFASRAASQLGQAVRGMRRHRLASLLAVTLLLAFEYLARGKGEAAWRTWTALALGGAVLATYLFELCFDAWLFRLRLWRHRWPDLLFALPAALTLWVGSVRAAASVLCIRLVVRVLLDVVAWGPGRMALQALLRRPFRLFALSFALLILLGTVALLFPAATADGEGTPLGVALFTATSAVCVTGLTVVDTGSYFSTFGHWVLLLLIQLGALGLMTLTSVLALAFRSRLSGAAQEALHRVFEEDTVAGLQRQVVSIALLTFTFELLGALTLYPSFTTAADGRALGPTERAFFAAFHAVSAFGNAGFSLYPDSLGRFGGDPVVMLPVMALIVTGGLGFPVLASLLDVRHWWRKGLRAGWAFLPLHTRLVLLTTAVLLGGGTVSFLVLEWGHSLSPLTFGDRLWASAFQSVALRTAGFSTVDLAQLGGPMLLVSLGLMFTGGSPGGTAGGVKTTTVAVLALTLSALMRRRSEVEVQERTVPAAIVYRACAVALLSLGLVFFFSVLLAAVEPQAPLRDVLFEAVSAFSTTGLSTGLTPSLSGAGQLVVCALMFVGRLGPFTLALALAFSQARASYSFPSAKLMVG